MLNSVKQWQFVNKFSPPFPQATKDIRVANAATNVPFIIIFPVLVMENVPVNNLPKVPLKQDIASAMVHTRATTAV